MSELPWDQRGKWPLVKTDWELSPPDAVTDGMHSVGDQ